MAEPANSFEGRAVSQDEPHARSTRKKAASGAASQAGEDLNFPASEEELEKWSKQGKVVDVAEMIKQKSRRKKSSEGSRARSRAPMLPAEQVEQLQG